ncbi:MAG: hypothetical protein Q8S16_11810, partial [Polaromonas sp.]|nr:hypothetical protein [Polaromonas sp.]
HNELLQAHGVQVIDNINMVTCGGQATIPIVAAASRVSKVHYGEIVASIVSKSEGPGTRANIDEFTETTRAVIEKLGRAERGKSIIVLNTAEPPLIMRDTVFGLSELVDQALVEKCILDMVADVRAYVPGYRLMQEVPFEVVPPHAPLNAPGIGPGVRLPLGMPEDQGRRLCQSSLLVLISARRSVHGPAVVKERPPSGAPA